MAVKLGKGVVHLGMPELELEIWDLWEAPVISAFSRELGRKPKLEGFRLTLELVTVVAAIDGCETGDVYVAAIMVLADALGKKVVGLRDLENLVRSLDLGPLRVP